jgi:hypothetical protein
MKFQATPQNETANVSPEIKSAYNDYRLAFFQRAGKEIDAKNDGSTRVVLKSEKEILPRRKAHQDQDPHLRKLLRRVRF